MNYMKRQSHKHFDEYRNVYQSFHTFNRLGFLTRSRLYRTSIWPNIILNRIFLFYTNIIQILGYFYCSSLRSFLNERYCNKPHIFNSFFWHKTSFNHDFSYTQIYQCISGVQSFTVVKRGGGLKGKGWGLPWNIN